MGCTKAGRFGLAAVVWAMTSACTTQTVTIDGREVPVEEAARSKLNAARAAMAEGDRARAEATYREIIDSFPDSEAVPKALDALAILRRDASGCDAARAFDERLIDEHPETPEARAARARRRDCAQGQVAGSTDRTLRDAYEQARTPSEKLEVAREAADAAVDGEQFGTAVLWLLEVDRLSRSTGADRDDVRSEIDRLIRERLSARELREVLERTRPRDFPQELVRFKLARVQQHVGDRANARASFQDYLKRYPEGRFASKARSMLSQMEAVEPVVPTRLGVLLPLSGRHQQYGDLAMQAIDMALRDATGIEKVVADTESDPVRAAEAAESLVREHQVIAILGPIFTYEAERAAVVAQRLGVPMLTISAADEIADVGPFVFRNGFTNAMQARALVSYAMDVLGFRRFAVLHPRHPYGEELLHLFWDEVERRRGEIRGVESYGVQETTFSDPVKALVARDDLFRRPDYVKAARECREQPDSYRQARCRENLRKNLKPIIDFDALFIPDYPRTISMVAAALAFEDVIVERDPKRLRVIEKTLDREVEPVTLLGASGWNDPRLIERADRNVENAVFTDGFFADAEAPEVRAFVSKYRERYGRTPRLYPEALFYDSARILKQVFASGPSTRSRFRDALQSVRDFVGVTGQTSFGDQTDASKVVQILTIRDGTIQPAPPGGFEYTKERDTDESNSGSEGAAADAEGFGGTASGAATDS